MFRNWWPKWLIQRSLPFRKGPRQPTSKSARPQPTQLCLELLEDRVVPTAGTLDASFGTGGMVLTPISNGFDQVNAVVSLANGSILAAGTAFSNTTGYDFAVAKYTTNGTLDPSFGSGGIVTTDFFGGNDVAHAMAVLGNGDIVVAGTAFNSATGNQFALAEYTATGTLVGSFGSGGLATTGFFGGGDDEAFALAVQSDGKLVVAGYAYNPGTASNDFALARFNADGTLDSTFGSGGQVTTGFAVNDDEIQSLAIQSNGAIVAAGFAFTGASYDFAVARYTTAGALDPTFGGGAPVTTDFAGSDDDGYAVALETSGDILVGGTATVPSTGTDFALAAYTPSGSLDSTFGTGGLVTTEFSGIDDEIHALAIEANGQVLAGGYTNDGSNYDFALTRYNTDGTVDTSFNPATSGLVTTNFKGGSDQAYGMNVQPSGAIVLAGAADDGSGNMDFGLARYVGGATSGLTGSSAATATGGIAGATAATLGNATFTDSNTSAPASDFTVSAVAWGDGSTDTSGLTVTGSGGSYSVNGTHLYSQEGHYNFTITVSGDGSTATITGTATVVNNALAITTTTLASYVTANVPGYNQTIATTGGTAPITFAVSAGALPAGLSFNTSTGVISGTPTTAGSSTFTITATDTSNATATQAYTLVIVPPEFAYNPTTDTLVITLIPSLPSFEYTQVTTASGGTTSSVYTFTLSGSSAPFVSQSFPSALLTTAPGTGASVTAIGQGLAGTAILSTNDTYMDQTGNKEETPERISLGSLTDAGVGTISKFVGNNTSGAEYTFLALSNFPVSYAYAGRADGTILLQGTEGTGKVGFVTAGYYSYIASAVTGVYAHFGEGTPDVVGTSADNAADFAYHYTSSAPSAVSSVMAVYTVNGITSSSMAGSQTNPEDKGAIDTFNNVANGFVLNTAVSYTGNSIARINDSPMSDTYVGEATDPLGLVSIGGVTGFSYMYVGAFPNFNEFDVAYGFGTYYASSTLGGRDIDYPGAPANNVFNGDWIQAFS